MGIFIQKKERMNKGPHFRAVRNEIYFSYAIRGVASYLLNTIFRFVFRMGGQYLLNYNEISGTRQYLYCAPKIQHYSAIVVDLRVI